MHGEQGYTRVNVIDLFQCLLSTLQRFCHQCLVKYDSVGGLTTTAARRATVQLQVHASCQKYQLHPAEILRQFYRFHTTVLKNGFNGDDTENNTAVASASSNRKHEKRAIRTFV